MHTNSPVEISPARASQVVDLLNPVDARRAGEKSLPPEKWVSHLDWAKNIATKIARWQGLSGQEADEVRGIAVLTLVRKAATFTPRVGYSFHETRDGHFRGWIHISIRAECLRECKRLRGGGTFHTPRSDKVLNPETGLVETQSLPTIERLPCRRTAEGIEEVEIADYREPAESALEAGEPEPVDDSRPRGRKRWNEDGELITNWTLQLTWPVSRKLYRILLSLA